MYFARGKTYFSLVLLTTIIILYAVYSIFTENSLVNKVKWSTHAQITTKLVSVTLRNQTGKTAYDVNVKITHIKSVVALLEFGLPIPNRNTVSKTQSISYKQIAISPLEMQIFWKYSPVGKTYSEDIKIQRH